MFAAKLHVWGTLLYLVKPPSYYIMSKIAWYFSLTCLILLVCCHLKFQSKLCKQKFTFYKGTTLFEGNNLVVKQQTFMCSCIAMHLSVHLIHVPGDT